MPEIHDALTDDAGAYFARNQATLERPGDPALEAIRRIHRVNPIGSLLEIGCSTGWRLESARRELGTACTGIEAGDEAVRTGRRQYPDIDLEQGLAPRDLARLLGGRKFDCVLLGFFTYLVPRADMFALAAEVDAALTEGGHLVVFDFLYPASVRSPYAHNPLLTTFKSDPSSPWTWSPTYCLVDRSVYLDDVPANDLRIPERWYTVDVLKKLPDAVGYLPVPAQESTHSD